MQNDKITFIRLAPIKLWLLGRDENHLKGWHLLYLRNMYNMFGVIDCS